MGSKIIRDRGIFLEVEEYWAPEDIPEKLKARAKKVQGLTGEEYCLRLYRPKPQWDTSKTQSA